jgi:hypothetical protein
VAGAVVPAQQGRRRAVRPAGDRAEEHVDGLLEEIRRIGEEMRTHPWWEQVPLGDRGAERAEVRVLKCRNLMFIGFAFGSHMVVSALHLAYEKEDEMNLQLSGVAGRRITVAGAAVLLGLGALAASQTTAQAHDTTSVTSHQVTATSFHQECRYLSDTQEYESVVYDQDGHYSGMALWEKNGDKMQAVDARSDGWWVVAHLSTGRTASTQYVNPSPWATGDLPEGHTYYMWVDMEQSGAAWSLPSCTVKVVAATLPPHAKALACRSRRGSRVLGAKPSFL